MTTVGLALGALWSAAGQLAGTFALRPYVFGFLAIFLAAGARDLGGARTVAFLSWGGGVAMVAELMSTRVGVPFGLYHYTGATRGAELFVGNVPLFSPLSFPFLAYASFCLARRVLGPAWSSTRGGRARAVLASGVLMMLLDVVIDPLAVRGERWFLGHIFYYPEAGLYFGVPLSNFLGWLVVGWLTVGGVLVLTPAARPGPLGPGIALYYLVLAVNLTITLWIGEWLMATAGIVVHLLAFLLLYSVSRMTAGRWSADHLSAPAISRGGESAP